MDYHIKMNWPTVPDRLANELIQYAAAAHDSWVTTISRGHYKQFHLPQDLRQWAYDNLPIPPTYDVMLFQYDGIAEGTRHIDTIRTHSYNYLLLTGGDTYTSWYDEEGTMLDTIQYDLHTWYRHEGSVRHGVSNMTSKRLALTVFERIKKS